MRSLVDYQNDSAGRWVRLGRLEVELHRIDNALLAAAKAGCSPPSNSEIFGALIDASVVCADAVDAHVDRPIPLHVRNELSRLHCAITDVCASLELYAVLSVKKEN